MFLRAYKLFVSHAWHRDDEYWRIVDMLDSAPHFRWENLSVPGHDPFDSNESNVLAPGLRKQIRECCAFIACCGMWVPHSDWILFEIQFARRIGRPIIAVPPWRQVNLPSAIAPYADAIASRQDSLVNAVRRFALPEGV